MEQVRYEPVVLRSEDQCYRRHEAPAGGAYTPRELHLKFRHRKSEMSEGPRPQGQPSHMVIVRTTGGSLVDFDRTVMISTCGCLHTRMSACTVYESSIDTELTTLRETAERRRRSPVLVRAMSYCESITSAVWTEHGLAVHATKRNWMVVQSEQCCRECRIPFGCLGRRH